MLLNLENPIDAPKLTVARLPYFSNLSRRRNIFSITSDAGLYLNWNPAGDDANGETTKDWGKQFGDELSNCERHKNHRHHCGWPRIGLLMKCFWSAIFSPLGEVRERTS